MKTLHEISPRNPLEDFPKFFFQRAKFSMGFRKMQKVNSTQPVQKKRHKEKAKGARHRSRHSGESTQQTVEKIVVGCRVFLFLQALGKIPELVFL
jgi:hypothetical protein